MLDGQIAGQVLTDQVAAISCGIIDGEALFDLDYAEDSTADTDANFVLTASGGIVEIQGTAEHHPFSPAQFNAMMALAQQGCGELFTAQLEAARTAS